MSKMEAKKYEKKMNLGFLAATISFILFYFVARAILESQNLTTALRVFVALFPVPFYVWFLVSFVRNVRGLDELERKIQLEALALAFPLAMLLIFTLGLMELAIDLPKEDWSYRHIWAMMPVLYFGSIVLARKKYQ